MCNGDTRNALEDPWCVKNQLSRQQYTWITLRDALDTYVSNTNCESSSVVIVSKVSLYFRTNLCHLIKYNFYNIEL